MKISLLALSSLLLLAACEEKKAPATAPAPPQASAPAPAAAAVPTAAAPAPTAAAAPGAAAAASEPAPIAVGTKMKCKVSDEEFTVGAKTPQVVYNGKRYAFCCADCLPEFNKDPAKFAAK
jgi:hypothetical protein